MTLEWEDIQGGFSRILGSGWGERIGIIFEILILAFLVYHMLMWIKSTNAWSLLKGLAVIGVFILVARLLNMNTIIWIVRNLGIAALTAVIVILQPELRKALEELGRRQVFKTLLPTGFMKATDEGLFSDKTINEIVRACQDMGRVRTGALIVVRQNQNLEEYEKTGIEVDGIVTSQLLINIFEHNTPLHDGAVIVQGNRIKAATCYLPLSHNTFLSKELGTRHRAGVGVSEETDSMTVIVSEETGKISVAYEGELYRDLTGEQLREKLRSIQNKKEEETEKKGNKEKKDLLNRKRRSKNEK